MDNFSPQFRANIKIPFSVLEVIDRIVQHRVGDGESSVTRTSVAIELLKLGARIEKKKMEDIEKGTNPFDKRLEMQLAFLADVVSKSNLKIDRFFKIYAEIQNLDKDLYMRIVENTQMSEREATLLKTLFMPLD